MNTSVMIPLKNGRQTKHEILRAEPHQRMSQRSYWRGCLGSVSHFCCEVSPPETTTQMFLKQKSLYCQPVAAWETCPNYTALNLTALIYLYLHPSSHTWSAELQKPESKICLFFWNSGLGWWIGSLFSFGPVLGPTYWVLRSEWCF